MEAYADVAPAHNPPYVAAMRLLAKELPEIPLVAAFETGFHETIAPAHRLYAVPLEWARSTASSAGAFTEPAIATSRERMAQLLEEAGRQDHFVSPRRQQFAVCHRGREVGGDQPGHESAERLAAQQPRRRLRSVSRCRR